MVAHTVQLLLWQEDLRFKACPGYLQSEFKASLSDWSETIKMRTLYMAGDASQWRVLSYQAWGLELIPNSTKQKQKPIALEVRRVLLQAEGYQTRKILHTEYQVALWHNNGFRRT